MKAVAYCRVSTFEQCREGISLDMQQDRIRAWCGAHGYQLVGVYVESMSGGRADNRPRLLEAVRQSCQIKAVLVVYSLSRLARSVKDTLALTERLDRAGANLASLSERIDTTSAVGKMVFRILSTLCEFERDQISERTENAMAHLRRINSRISLRIPFGYDLDKDNVSLKLNESEQQVIGQMIHWRGKGLSFAAIANRLTAERIRTKQGKCWYAATVKSILDRKQKLPDETETARRCPISYGSGHSEFDAENSDRKPSRNSTGETGYKRDGRTAESFNYRLFSEMSFPNRVQS